LVNSPPIETSSLRTVIIDTINKDHPQNVTQLIDSIQKQTPASTNKIFEALFELQAEKKLTFKEQVFDANPNNLVDALRKSTWYWITLTLIVASSFVFFFASLGLNSIYLLYIQSFFGFALVLFLPGYAFVKLLFGSKMPFGHDTNTDYIILVGLSVGLSVVLVPIAGLALNYTPWGITFTSLTITLSALTYIFANAAVVREYLYA
jgi:uncharacterized membrane protein